MGVWGLFIESTLRVALPQKAKCQFISFLSVSRRLYYIYHRDSGHEGVLLAGTRANTNSRGRRSASYAAIENRKSSRISRLFTLEMR